MRIPLLVLLALLSISAKASPHEQPPPARSEVAIERWSVDSPGLLFREYDLAGSKSEFIRGTSVLGSPDLKIPRLGIYTPVQRLSQKAAGLYSSRLEWHPWDLGLSGENGRLVDPSGLGSPIDTPVILMDWQRSAFSGNSLRLDFQRSLVDSVFFDLGMVVHSTDSSASFRYQDITHQPYLGTLKRDSSQVPLSGRNLAFDSFLMHPRIVWFSSIASLGVSYTSLRMRNDDATRHWPVQDSLEKWKIGFDTIPYTTRVRLNGLGFEANLHSSKAWNLQVWHQFLTLSQISQNTPSRVVSYGQHSLSIARDTVEAPFQIIQAHDTLILDTVRTAKSSNLASSQQTGEAKLAIPAISGIIAYEYEYRNITNWRNDQFQDISGSLWNDRELGSLRLEDSVQVRNMAISAVGQAGLQRNGLESDQSAWAPAISLQGLMRLNDRVRLQGNVLQDTRFPDLEETSMNQSGRITFGNPDLEKEVRNASEFSASYFRPAFAYGLGLRHEVTQDPIRLGWMANPDASSLTEQAAFGYINLNRMTNLSWRCFGGFHLGNWDFWAERESALLRRLTLPSGTVLDQIPDSPTRTYKGTVAWEKTVVNGNLHLNIRWDFEWIGPTEDFGINEEGMATRGKLDKNMVLDFEARMRIRTFELYGRMDNLNHTKLTPGAGYTPPGVTFRYGILWQLKD